MIIALTNDDGIQAPGLRAIYAALIRAGHTVYCVAPVTEQSAVGHAVTLSMPLRVKDFSESDFQGKGVYGTPVDCIKLGLSRLLPQTPDIVVSGINAGANVGPDILYSGTVSAATEGALLGIPSVAVSYDSFSIKNITEHATLAVSLIEKIAWKSLPKRCVVNMNLPSCGHKEIAGVKICPQTNAVWKDWYEERTDPRGQKYWWLDGVIPPETVGEGTDRALLSAKWVTITPLEFSFTDHNAMQILSSVET